MIRRKKRPHWIYVSTERWTVGIEVVRDTIVKAPAIVRWAVGKEVDWFKNYLERKNVLLNWVPLKN